jgi:hypothetical protein
MSPDLLEALVKLLEYNYEDEKRNWEECGKPDNHIFTSIKKLMDYVNSISEWTIDKVEP